MRILVTGATGNIGTECMSIVDSCDDIIGVARHNNGNGAILTVDLSDWYAVDRFVIDQDSFDLVIMAHGVQEPISLRDVTVNDWNTIVNNNLASCVALTTALVRHNKLRDNSLIVYCSSIQATHPRAGRGLYAIAKAGVEALCKIAAVELAPRTRTVALRLGQLTQLMKGIDIPAQALESMRARSQMPWVDPVDVAYFCLQLYDQPSLTGSVIDLSSGHELNIW